jgi:hypothetical protein
MKSITIGFGILLILLGIGNYVGAGRLTALLPALFGLAICVLGFVERPQKKAEKHAFFGTVFLAILGLLGSVRGLINLFSLLAGGSVARPMAVIAQAAIAVVCILFVVLAVRLTPNFWQGWKAFGHFLGNLIARVALTIFYFTIFMPFALGVKWFSDPLHLKMTSAKLWQSRITGDQTLEEVLRQF